MLPTDIEEYRRVAAYHSVGSVLRRNLSGTIIMPNNIAYTDVISAQKQAGGSDRNVRIEGNVEQKRQRGVVEHMSILYAMSVEYSWY